MAKSTVATVVLLALVACRTPETTSLFSGPAVAGEMAAPQNREASGLAVSRRAPGMLWTHEDSDGAPVLYALDARGALRGKVRIEGVTNIDWEDISSYSENGKAWLCVADVGDNNAVRPFVLLHFVEEPDPAELRPDGELSLRPRYTLKVVFEDGPRDCEAVAVDARESMVYLLTKREPVPRLYRVPLHSAALPAVARLAGTMPHRPQPSAAQRLLKIPTGLYRASPCAMDFAADGSMAAVLTYGDVLVFPRHAGETWGDALGREPVVLPSHGLGQAEAVAYSADGRTLFVCSEDDPRLLRYDRH